MQFLCFDEEAELEESEDEMAVRAELCASSDGSDDEYLY